MSYILDALKKSDQKRKVGNVPGLQSDHRALVNVERKRRMAPIVGSILLCLMVVNGGLWLWWAKPWQAIFNKGESQLSSVVVAPRESVSLPEANAEASVSPMVPPDSGQRFARAARTEMAPAAPVIVPQRTEIPVQASPALPVSSGRQKLARKVEAIEPDILGVPETADQVVSPSSVPAPDEGFVEPVHSQVMPEVQEVSALPEHIQAALPQVNISLHFYSNEPRSRLARINGRHLHEGDVVANDLRLREITADGAIFTFRGYHFRMDKF